MNVSLHYALRVSTQIAGGILFVDSLKTFVLHIGRKSTLNLSNIWLVFRKKSLVFRKMSLIFPKMSLVFSEISLILSETYGITLKSCHSNAHATS